MGTHEGGKKIANALMAKDPNYYHKIGAKGGSVKVKKGFGTNHARAVAAGRIGGKISKRPPAWMVSQDLNEPLIELKGSLWERFKKYAHIQSS